MDTINGKVTADNAEETMKCPVCGAMINISGIMGPIDCPVCGRTIDQDEVTILGASNEGY